MSLADKLIIPWAVSARGQKPHAATPATPESATRAAATKPAAPAAKNPPKVAGETARPERQPEPPNWKEIGITTVAEAIAEAASGNPPKRPLLRQPERVPTLLDALREANARGVPPEWRRGVASLDPGRPISDVPPERWRRFVEDARVFVRGPFAAAAAALGWDAVSLFGCDRDRPYARIDQMGLTWLTGGGELLAMSSAVAIIRTKTGARQTYRRRRSPGYAVPAWDLTDAIGGDAPRAA